MAINNANSIHKYAYKRDKKKSDMAEKERRQGGGRQRHYLLWLQSEHQKT